MKLSALITSLQKLHAKHGDVTVYEWDNSTGYERWVEKTEVPPVFGNPEHTVHPDNKKGLPFGVLL